MNKKIKILFTIPNFDTAGSGKVVYDIVSGLDKEVFAPEICCFHNKGEFFKIVKGLGVKIHLFEFATSYRPFATFPLRVFRIYRFFKRNKFDMIHSWHWSSDISEPLAAKFAKIPFIYTKKAMGWGNKSWVWRSNLSTNIIAINSDMMSQFFSKMLSKTSHIPLGVDTNYFQPMHKSYKTPEGIKIGKSDFVVVSIANLVPVKGIELLLEAVRLLNDITIKVLIVGDYDNVYGFKLKEKYECEQIHFLGKKKDIRTYLAVSNVFVISTLSLGEGLPIAPMEAMASGRIVLGSDVSGIRDILNVFPLCLFPSGNILALSEKLKTAKERSREDQENMNNKMRKHVLQFYNIETCITQHELLYKNILKNY